MRTLAVLIALLLFPAVADDYKKAFKPLRLPKPKKLEKELGPRLPKGIVIDAAPFDGLVASLLEPHTGRLDMREKVIATLDDRQLASAFKVLAKENAELEKRIAKVEEAYAEHYNKGFDQRSEGAKRTRKLASVLLPFYRTLRLRNARIAAAAKPGESALSAPDPALRAAAVRASQDVAAVSRALLEDKDEGVRADALLALLRFKVKEIKPAVIAALGDASWRVRALAIATCVRGRLVEAAGPLVEALAKEDGRLRKDIDDALFALTGTRMYGDVDLWRKWFAANGERLAKKAAELAEAGEYDKVLGSLEAAEIEEGDESKRKGGTSAFYGIPTQSKRMVFVVDISRSMQDQAQARPSAPSGRSKDPYPGPMGASKLAIAKWQLHRAAEGLPKDALLAVVVYSESYAAWNDKLAPATARNKKKLHKFVDALNGNGTTNIADSLDKALELAPDTIYLLSDGDPNRGRVSNLKALLDEFLARNVRARTVVHTVGIGEAAGSTFLKELAKGTGGRYVEFK
ncbi:MAG: HEAT repeat domain-containing protein [Planctomycetota bacterium]